MRCAHGQVDAPLAGELPFGEVFEAGRGHGALVGTAWFGLVVGTLEYV